MKWAAHYQRHQLRFSTLLYAGHMKIVVRLRITVHHVFHACVPYDLGPTAIVYLGLNTFAAVNTSPIAMSLYIESSAVLILQGWFDEEGVLLTCLITPQLVVAADAPAIGDAPIAPTPLDVVTLKDGSVLLWRSHRNVWWGALYQDCGCCGQYRQDKMGQRGEAGHQPPNPVSSQKKGQC